MIDLAVRLVLLAVLAATSALGLLWLVAFFGGPSCDGLVEEAIEEPNCRALPYGVRRTTSLAVVHYRNAS